MSEQRWLSLEGICSTLQITHGHAIWLAKQGYLQVIWGKGGSKNKGARFLDPTPEYANKLKLSEALYTRIYPLPIDLDMVPMLSLREVAQIMGWKMSNAENNVYKKKLTGGVLVGKTNLYSIATVRALLWRKEGRKLSKQRAPFLIQHLIEFFLAAQAEDSKAVPTDLEFSNDDILQRKFELMAQMPTAEREAAMRELWEKIALAKTVAKAVRGTPRTAQIPSEHIPPAETRTPSI